MNRILIGLVILAFILINIKCEGELPVDTESPKYGSIQGVMQGAKSNKFLPNAGIVLAEVIGEGVCSIRGELVTSTNSNGQFTFSNVSEATYVVFYNTSNEYLQQWKNLSGTQIYYGLLGKQLSNYAMNLPPEFLISFAGLGSGGGIIIAANTSITFRDGKIIDVDGSFGSTKYNFFIDYHDSNPFTIPVFRNKTTNVTFRAWNL